MTAQHSGLTPDLPPVIEVPDLPGAKLSRFPGGEEFAGGEESAGREDEEEPAAPAGAGHESGAHQEGDGRHGCAAGGSGG
ncbi:hypothetical protein [Streptomyces orinoci]|uniref:Uncharacterized protein n=1 Tax=Streptomyces orinoci TaxID=67339 RepID=A0ABV3JS34_STRON|nr:hypothetical protein [Streptomyces orinoci]